MKELNKLLRNISIFGMIFGTIFLPYSICKAQNTLNIDASQKYQIIEGFGGHLDFQQKITGDYESTQLWDIIVNDLGLNFIRIPFPVGFEQENDDSDPYHFNWSAFDPTRIAQDENGKEILRGEINLDVKTLVQLKNHGLENFFVTPIAYVPWITENQSLYYSGGVNQSMYEEFGEMVSAFIQLMKRDYGIDIKYVSPLNEPDVGPVFGVGSGKGKIQNLIRVLHQRFEHDGLDVKVVAPEIGQPENTPNWEFEGSQEEMPDIYTWHQYGRDCLDLYNYCSVHKLPNWQTETCALGRGDEVFKDGLDFAIYIHESLVNAESSVWFWYTLWSRYLSGYNIIAADDNLNVQSLGSKYYGIRQFSHYIKPDSRRIEVKGGAEPAYERGPFLYGGIYPSAYLHSDGDFTIVIINDTANSESINFVLNNLEVESLEKIRFSSSENSEQIGNISVSGNSFTDTLPASSVTTYTTQSYNLPPVVDITPPVPPTGVRVNNP